MQILYAVVRCPLLYKATTSTVQLNRPSQAHWYHRCTDSRILTIQVQLLQCDLVTDPSANNSQDGGFFVFPDISVRLEGDFRLRFSLFEIMKYVTLLSIIVSRQRSDYLRRTSPPKVVFIKAVTSNPFVGECSKDLPPQLKLKAGEYIRLEHFLAWQSPLSSLALSATRESN